ncbi:MAG: hypothetical protein AB8H86_17335 [Polyangiales bacterium]
MDMLRLVLAFTLVSLLGCGRARLVDDPLPDASGTRDAGAADVPTFDVARFDVPRVDAFVPRDAGNDAGAPGNRLEEALTCGIDNEGAVRAALRTSECAGIPFSQTYEAYEAFLFARSAFHLSNLPEGNCEYWRCVAEADNCADFNVCFEEQTCPLEPPMPFCEGDSAVSCGGHPVAQVIDCASFGGSCERGICVFEDGCSASFTSDNDLRCRDGQIGVCGETLSCATRSDFGCNRVQVQGEIPVAWCGQAAAGLYGTPNDCLSETRLLYVSASGAVVEFECPDFGYRFCSPEGCTSL